MYEHVTMYLSLIYYLPSLYMAGNSQQSKLKMSAQNLVKTW